MRVLKPHDFGEVTNPEKMHVNKMWREDAEGKRMKKVNSKLSNGLVLALIIFLIFCSSLALKSVPDDQGNVKEENWPMLSGFTTNYVKLGDINPGAVPEVKLGFPIDGSNFIIKETMDGFLCGYMLTPMSSSAAKDPQRMTRIRKLGKDGNIVWDKEYDGLIFYGKINNLLIFLDGSYVFSVHTYQNRNKALVYEKSSLVKCDQHGAELWRQDFGDYSGDLLRHLFLAENNEIIAVGRWLSENGKQTSAGTADIVVPKPAGDGRVLQQKGFGGSNFDNLRCAQYDKVLGIIINGTR